MNTKNLENRRKRNERNSLPAGEAGAEEFVFDIELGEAEESSLAFSKAFSFWKVKKKILQFYICE